MFKEKLQKINSDIIDALSRSKEDLLEEMIKSNLEISYSNYCNNLKLNYDYLLRRSTIKVLKNIKKVKAKEEKESL